MKKVSDLLRDERLAKGLSLDDIEKATKINKNFLIAIEEGKFHTLPSESYALGFVKNYAQFLHLSVSRVAALFRREYEGKTISIVPGFRREEKKFKGASIFSPRSLLVLGSFLILFFYIVFNFASFFIGPRLEVRTPKDGQIISGNVADVTGITDQYASLFINESEVSLSLSGKFKKSLYLFSGDQKITVVSKNRFGKQTQKVISVKVE